MTIALRLVRLSQRVRPHGSRSLLQLQHITCRELSSNSASIPQRHLSRPTRSQRTISQPRRWQSNESKNPTPTKSDQPGPNTQLADTLKNSDTSDLITEVKVPNDPDGVLSPNHPAMSVLENSSLVIQRQIELLNIVLPIEQANRYVILDGKGNTIGYLLEQDHGVGREVARQVARLHRSFTAYVLDKDQREILRIHRPFTYINSRISIYDPVPPGGYEEASNVPVPNVDQRTGTISPLKLDDMRIIGQCQQIWAAAERKYNLSQFRPNTLDNAIPNTDQLHVAEPRVTEKSIEARMEQFAKIQEPMLSWDFTARTEEGQVISSVNRNFRGLAREAFTDTGLYVLRMDAASSEGTKGEEVTQQMPPGLTLDQRAVMIATAVSIDFDYFSSNSSMIGNAAYAPLFWPVGGAAAEGGAAAGVGGGVIEGAGAGVAGAAGRGVAGAGGAMESGIAGAGTMAGYEAMQRSFGRDAPVDDASPTNPDQFDTLGSSARPEDGQSTGQEDVWGSGDDPWKEESSTSNTGGENTGEGGIWASVWDWLTDS